MLIVDHSGSRDTGSTANLHLKLLSEIFPHLLCSDKHRASVGRVRQSERTQVSALYELCCDFKVAVLAAVKLQREVAAVAVQAAEFKIAVFIRFTRLKYCASLGEFDFYTSCSVGYAVFDHDQGAADETAGEVV